MIPIIIDTETLGFSPPHGHVIQIAAIALCPDEPREYEAYCNPGQDHLYGDMADSSFEYNGIDRDIILQASDSSVIAFQFNLWIQKLIKEFADNPVFYAYNYQFDMRFLIVEPWNLALEHWAEDDVMEMARILLCNSERGYMTPNKSPKLTEAVHGLDIQMPGRHHDALNDVRATAEVYRLYQKFISEQ